MGIFQGDIIIKNAIELGLEDMRKNPWLIDHMLEDLSQNTYFKNKYGQKQIEACKDWFLNNKIDIYMRHRKDKDQLPCITIAMAPNPEIESMKLMADQSTETIMLLPNKIGKPIPYIVRPFTPTSYDPNSGEVGIPSDITDLDTVAPGMVLVDPSTGNGYVIEEIVPNGIKIQAGVSIEATQLGIVPQYQYYTARIEHTFFQDTYQIGCHSHGEAQSVIWLWSIVLYSILRYKESLLEAQGFTQSTVSNSDLDINESWSSSVSEEVWSRFITLSGIVENSWIKTPQRIIEKISLREKANNSKGFVGGIKILSNTTPDTIEQQSDKTW